MSRDPVLWLVSYPKSGNTWFRFVLFHLQHGRMPESSRELDQQFNSKLPVKPGERFKKSHATVAGLAEHRRAVDKAIYIVRHPLDVLQSSLNYDILNGDLLPEKSAKDTWIDAYIRTAGNPAWTGEPFNAGSWNENVRGWMDEAAEDVLVIRYEESLTDPVAGVMACAAFMEVPVTEKEIAVCVEATSFDRLRIFEEEEQALARERRTPQGRFSSAARTSAAEQQGVRFFNKGKSGTYRDVLDTDRVDRAWEAFADVAASLGYLV